MTEPPQSQRTVRAGFITRQEVAYQLGVSLRTLRRTERADPSFPRFFALTPGVWVIARTDLDAWVQAKVTRARAAAVLGSA